MNPFYFGESKKRLFGIYHPPGSDRVRSTCVVLCPPAFREYVRAHRAFRQLALLLAANGFPVLRFDYFGTGDSAGDSAEAGLGQWKLDVLTAVDEIINLGTSVAACLVGLRLGAVMAAEAADEHPAVRSVVLWDPVVSGRRYLEELHDQHRRITGRPADPVAADAELGLCGFPLAPRLRAELGRLVLSSPGGGATTLMVTSFSDEGYAELEARLEAHGAAFSSEHVPSQKLWETENEESKQLVPKEILELIASWID